MGGLSLNCPAALYPYVQDDPSALCPSARNFYARQKFPPLGKIFLDKIFLLVRFLLTKYSFGVASCPCISFLLCSWSRAYQSGEVQALDQPSIPETLSWQQKKGNRKLQPLPLCQLPKMSQKK